LLAARSREGGEGEEPPSYFPIVRRILTLDRYRSMSRSPGSRFEIKSRESRDIRAQRNMASLPSSARALRDRPNEIIITCFWYPWRHGGAINAVRRRVGARQAIRELDTDASKTMNVPEKQDPSAGRGMGSEVWKEGNGNRVGRGQGEDRAGALTGHNIAITSITATRRIAVG